MGCFRLAAVLQLRKVGGKFYQIVPKPNGAAWEQRKQRSLARQSLKPLFKAFVIKLHNKIVLLKTNSKRLSRFVLIIQVFIYTIL